MWESKRNHAADLSHCGSKAFLEKSGETEASPHLGIFQEGAASSPPVSKVVLLVLPGAEE